MNKQKWSLKEEKVLIELFFKHERFIDSSLVAECANALIKNNFTERPFNKIRAKLYDIKRIDDGNSIEHVAQNTVIAYKEYPEKPANPILTGGIDYANQSVNKTISLPTATHFIETNPLFRDGEIRTGKTFEKMMEELIDRCEFEYRPKMKWSDIYNNAGVDHSTANEIRYGRRLSRTDNKYNLLKLLFVMKIDFETTNLLLSKVNLAFNDLSRTDVLIMRALKMRIFNKRILNEALVSEGELPLFVNVYSGA